MPAPKNPKKYREWKNNLYSSWQNPERKKKMSNLFKNRKFSKETLRKMSEAAKKRNGKENPFYGKKHTEETRRKISKANSGKNSARYGKPAWNKNKEISQKTRRKISQSMEKKYLENPSLRKKLSLDRKGKKFSIEHRSKISKKTKEFYKKNPEFNKHKNNPMWQGGISFSPYNILFNKKFKEKIKNKYGKKCIHCKKNNKINIHHINYIKLHSTPLNCIPVCHKCNTKFNSNRDFWFAYWCNFLNIRQEDNMKEAGIISKMGKEELLNLVGNIKND